MDPQTTVSFIPKKPLIPESRRRKNGIGIVMLVCIFIFVLSLVAAGGVFAYTQYLEVAVRSKSDSLTKAQEAYEPGVIEDLARLDQRIISGRDLLARHIALSTLFSFLSTQTLERVRFNSFGLSLDEENAGTLTLSGEAENFSTIALQSDQFGASKMLRNVIFSDIVINSETGRVTFSVGATVEPDLILYSNTFSNATVDLPTQSELESTEAATSTPIATSTSPEL
jgi:hypothetical protein